MVSAQLSLFDTAAVIKPIYKVGDRVKVRKKPIAATYLKKGDVVEIVAVHPINGSIKFWNERSERWEFLHNDEIGRVVTNDDSPTPTEITVGESNCQHSDTDTIPSIEATIESNCQHGEIDSPTATSAGVGESNCQHGEIDSPTATSAGVGESIAPLADSDCLNPISIYKPRGTARGEKDHFYYRLSYKEGNKVRQVHIKGGNTDSPISQAKVQEVRSLLATGIAPSEIAAMLKTQRSM
jgi:hypothetical protein